MSLEGKVFSGKRGGLELGVLETCRHQRPPGLLAQGWETSSHLAYRVFAEAVRIQKAGPTLEQSYPPKDGRGWQGLPGGCQRPDH